MNNEFDFLARLKLRISYFRIITTSEPRTRDSNYEYKQGTGYVRFLGYYGQMGQEDLTDLRILSEKSLTYIKYENKRKKQAVEDFKKLKKEYEVYRNLWKKYDGLTFISQQKEQDAESEIRNTFLNCNFGIDLTKPFKNEYSPVAIINNSFWDDLKYVLDENEKELDFILNQLAPAKGGLEKPKLATGKHKLFYEKYFEQVNQGYSGDEAAKNAAGLAGYKSTSIGQKLRASLRKGEVKIKRKGKISIMRDDELIEYNE
jgi:hypothetical protein